MTGSSERALQGCDVRSIHPQDVVAVRDRLLPDDAYAGLADLFGALADPTRARIVHALLVQELCTCDLASLLGVTDSAVSQHLRVLRNLRLVRHRRAGRIVYYSLDDAHVAVLVGVGLTHQGHAPGSLGRPALASPVQRAS